MTKKPVIISGIFTALAGIAKCISGILKKMVATMIINIAGVPPVKSSAKGIAGFFSSLSYGAKMTAYGAKKASAVALTLPLTIVSNVFGFLGKIFIPLLILTIILLIVTIFMSMKKKHKIKQAKAQEATVNQGVMVDGTGDSYGMSANVFNRMQ